MYKGIGNDGHSSKRADRLTSKYLAVFHISPYGWIVKRAPPRHQESLLALKPLILVEAGIPVMVLRV